jgi:DNA topoisomerase-6 subunit A
MGRLASRETVDLLGAFLRRQAALSDEDIQLRMENLANGRARRPDSHSPFVLPAVDADDRAFPEGALVAADLNAVDVRARIAHFTDHVTAQVKAGELPRIDLPDRHRANCIYDARGNVFLGHNVRPLAFDERGAEAFMRLLLALETASDNLRHQIHTTKRGLFYQHRTKLPNDADQLDSDRALVSLANVLRVRRRALGFVEAPRGSVYGRLVIRDGTEVVDLAQVGPGGRAIPRFTDDVDIVSSDAALIAIVEKEAVAFRLAQERWWDTARCIMVCGSGFPSMSAREFVRSLIDTLKIPVVIFADADPGGVQLALTYAHGSISTALETPWLACGDIRWAGLCPSDFDRHCGIRDQIRLAESDKDKARALLQHSSRTYVNDRVREELAIMVDRGFKVELDALCSGSRLVDYLQHKLADGDLIKL